MYILKKTWFHLKKHYFIVPNSLSKKRISTGDKTNQATIHGAHSNPSILHTAHKLQNDTSKSENRPRVQNPHREEVKTGNCRKPSVSEARSISGRGARDPTPEKP